MKRHTVDSDKAPVLESGVLGWFCSLLPHPSILPHTKQENLGQQLLSAYDSKLVLGEGPGEEGAVLNQQGHILQPSSSEMTWNACFYQVHREVGDYTGRKRGLSSLPF